MSTKTINGGLRALEQSDLAMVTYNQDYTDEQPVIDYAQKNKKGILVKKALGSGHHCLAGSTAESLRFVFKQEGVSSVLIGSINQNHIKENAEIISNLPKFP
jgi:predicted aldo/keto reductase-like oxidoreductase